MSESTITPEIELAARAGAGIGAHGIDVRVNDDGSLGFEYEGALCSLRALGLAPGLVVLSVTCVLAWDRPLKTQLHKRVAERNNELQFGSLTLITRDRLADVLLRYTFPGNGLDDLALTTMLMLVLGGVREARQGLLAP
ncbi:YbjN domain-containing protein [Nocardia thailandica]|uniref:YbjN domain-containing protein n=1 Tax=Nocardia thailandica TaxID=257275 RepID=A0ABW6PHY8_9NOCA|nr:hypothetical protein [Nocardia thailandica]